MSAFELRVKQVVFTMSFLAGNPSTGLTDTMSLSFADSSYIDSISQWVTGHQWSGSGQQQSILVVQVDDTAQQHHVQSGFGYFEISASYTPGVDQLDNLTVSLDIPSYGLVLLAEQPMYPLSADPGQSLTVSVADSITGDVSFKYVGDGDDMEVFCDYTLDVPFSDTLEDSTSIFPVDLQRVRIVGGSQSSSLKRSEGKARMHLETRTSDHQLFSDFLNDVSKDGDKVLIVTYPPADTGASKEFTIDVSFLGVLNLVGTVNRALSISASLYIKIPLADKVRIAHLDGALGSGITVEINTGIATGTATLTVEQNPSGKHDLYIDANLSCELIGNISTGKLFLFTSPF